MSEDCTQISTKPPVKPARHLVDKLKARKAYVYGSGSLSEVSKNLGIPFHQLHRWSAAEKWSQLKIKYDKQELDKLFEEPEPKQQQTDTIPPTPATVTQRQLGLVNEALILCDNPKEIEALTRAKLNLEESLHVQIHGSKVGTQRPERKRPLRQVGFSPMLPEPEQPTQDTQTPQDANPPTETPQHIVFPEAGQ